jgi:ABC-2 type transport system ATP-binding protein
MSSSGRSLVWFRTPASHLRQENADDPGSNPGGRIDFRLGYVSYQEPFSLERISNNYASKKMLAEPHVKSISLLLLFAGFYVDILYISPLIITMKEECLGALFVAQSSELALKLNGISKRFGDIVAVDFLNLEIKSGEVFGLLGPNGSGKSSTLKMILGLVKPDSGFVDVFGVNVQERAVDVKRMTGYVPESPKIYEFLTGLEFLDLTGDIYGMNPSEKKKRIEEYLRAMELEGREGDLISSYSEGMKQKIVVISALIHRPRLLLLDEPLSGLDPRSARIIKDLIHELASEGVTTIMSTHVLEIAQAMCDRIAIMYEGRLLALGTMEELRQEASMPSSGLEDIFLKLTGTSDVRPVIEALLK